jgi:LPXTG-site transpeptidase (sortase) family protein
VEARPQSLSDPTKRASWEPRQLRGARLRAGPLLLLLGLTLLVGWSGSLVLVEWRQLEAATAWQRAHGAAERPGQVPPPPQLMRPVDGVDFRLRVPRLSYEAMVREGVSPEVLFGSPGRYPETHWPGQLGNVGVAAHNVYWLRFDQLAPGDQLLLDTRYGTFHYRVTGMEVVSPEDRSVLGDAPGRRLTLTTCWPLWAGQFAPYRLAIFAA